MPLSKWTNRRTSCDSLELSSCTVSVLLYVLCLQRCFRHSSSWKLKIKLPAELSALCYNTSPLLSTKYLSENLSKFSLKKVILSPVFVWYVWRFTVTNGSISQFYFYFNASLCLLVQMWADLIKVSFIRSCLFAYQEDHEYGLIKTLLISWNICIETDYFSLKFKGSLAYQDSLTKRTEVTL